MNRFQFRLARVQEYRQRQLEVAEEKLRRVVAELEEIRRRKESLRTAYLEEEAAVAASRSVQPADRAALAEYRHHVQQEMVRFDRRLAECAARADEHRKLVREAQRRYRLLERLHEKRKAEWDREFTRETDALAEESFLARWRPS